MALANGVRLWPYEILAPIGSGGMGEVYRAKDTRLDRLVAIKVRDLVKGLAKNQVAFVDVATGSVRVVLPPRAAIIRGLAWLGGEAIVLNGPSEVGAPFQLWRLSYPDGQMTHLTTTSTTTTV